MRVDWLADVLRGAGVPICPLDGWRGRGHPLQRVEGVVLHHTATGRGAADEAVAHLLRDGRSDLPGPLAQVGLDRKGRWWLISDGRCNHNGYGTWGNDAIGVEAFNSGLGESWPEVQLDSWARGVAAILAHLKLPIIRAQGHRETDPGRKIDPAGVDLDAFRRRVAGHQSVLTAPPQEDLMAIVFRDPRTKWVYLVEGGVKRHIDRATLTALQQMGATKGEPVESVELAELFPTAAG